MNKVIALIAVAVVIIGGWLMFRGSGVETGVEALNPMPSTETEETQTAVKEFTVTGSSFAFTPNTLTVNKGDTVKITFVNSAGFHDLVIDEFNARTKQINAGESETITFVADRSGTFEYYCSVGTHRQMGMVGTLVVN